MKFESMSVYFFILIMVFSLFPNVYGEIKFEDVTIFAGLQYDGNTYGSSWGDFNGDGWADLWQGNHGTIGDGSKLFENTKTGIFLDVGKKLGFEKIFTKYSYDNHGASWADYDNDGDQDLIILVGAEQGLGNGSNIFLVNNVDSFEDKSEIFGLDYPLGRGRMPLWFDWNQDGLLDILLSNNPRPDDKAPTVLFTQTPQGFIREKTFDELEGVSAVQISDISNDGKMDLIFFSGNITKVFEISNGQFVNIKSKLGLDKIRGIDWVTADFNNDLNLDIFLSTNNLRNDKLFFNTGNDSSLEKKFEEVTNISGLENPTSCKGIVSGDFDNDMDLDIYTVCSIFNLDSDGIITTLENYPNRLYENLGNGTFFLVSDVSGASGTQLGLGESVSLVDFDNDGFLDLYVTNGWQGNNANSTGPSQLFRNLGNENNWLEIDLVGTISNRDGIGSQIILSSDNQLQKREQMGGMHYRAQNHQRIHFGLADNSFVEYIIVYWPSNIVSLQKNINANQILKIIEPLKSISPKSQLDVGINPLNIKCNEGLELIFKTEKKIACVKNFTSQKLIDRGWYQDIKLLNSTNK